MIPWDWPWRPGVGLLLVTVGAVYVRGWVRLRRRSRGRLRSTWRLAAYLGGLLTIALALMSPVDRLAELLFAAHMVQHQLLLMLAPPLLLLGNPVPPILWGLPPPLRRAVGGSLARGGHLRRALRRLTWMPVAGAVYSLNLWLWHLPAAYQAALGHAPLHDLEHLAFFGAALLFWWPVIGPAPRWEARRGTIYYGLRIVYVILVTAQNTLLGAVIGLTERVLYPWYAATTPRVFDLSPLDDQALGGGIMWSGSHMYLVALLILVGYAMDAEGRRGPVSLPPGQPIPRAPHGVWGQK